MGPTTRRGRKKPPSDVGTPDHAVSVAGRQQPERPVEEAPEPGIWRTLGRLLRESVYAMCFIGVHWGLKWFLTKTKQEDEWWAVYLLNVTALYALIAVVIIFGAELVTDCIRAIRRILK